MLNLTAAAVLPTTSPSLVAQSPHAAQLLAAAEALLPDLAAGRAIEARTLRVAMVAACGGSDAEGAWTWKDAYEACEAAQLLFLRRFGPAMRQRPRAAQLAMLAKLAALLPSQTRRSEESQALQQFSTPIGLGLIASIAAGVTPTDLVLEPSAGTGLLAIFAELAGAALALNELAETRADLLSRLFPATPVTRHDAAFIDDHLDAGLRPTVVLMNPPFSAAAHVDGRVADAALRHIASALARVAEGGRLVAITGANLSPETPRWRDGFARLQERGTVVFSAAIDGRVYARHGTTTETRLTVIDRAPAAEPTTFPTLQGMAPDLATLLGWVEQRVPPRQAITATRSYAVPAPRKAACAVLQRARPVARSRRRPPTRYRSPTRPATGRRPTAAGLAPASMSPMRCNRCGSRRLDHTRRRWCSPPPWPRSRHLARATCLTCPPASSGGACFPMLSSRR